MKKLVITLACLLVLLSLISGCTKDKDEPEQSPVPEQTGSLYFDVALPDQGAVPYVGFVPDDSSDGFIYDFKDPENSDGIVVTPKE